MEKKTKEIHYKHAGFTGPKVSIDLQAAVEEALKHLSLPESRLETLGTNGDEARVLLDPRHHQAQLCVTMSSYVQGTQQPIVGISPKQKIWPIPAVAGTRFDVDRKGGTIVNHPQPERNALVEARAPRLRLLSET
jgi:hypothetical protein